ncbi:hypothetical protein I7I53_11039 [Histoplasma capsulatum var. duboisii H88]|uniref:Uncharacterized protein n=1 Tax=Ajellomyces capsulatus (strain H88) TaxID=544711 RepID=A0A8A1LD39_AJEC8|nr:hypothetical protein I7I53_11039 [Histoplasma capsulatum var. duboisii H88]
MFTPPILLQNPLPKKSCKVTHRKSSPTRHAPTRMYHYDIRSLASASPYCFAALGPYPNSALAVYTLVAVDLLRQRRERCRFP